MIEVEYSFNEIYEKAYADHIMNTLILSIVKFVMNFYILALY